MSYQDLLEEGKVLLRSSDVLSMDEEDVRSDAWWLFADACQMDQMEFLMKRKQEAAEEERNLFLQWIQRRKNGEPVAYILGGWEFMGLPFKTTPAVLIPRQDTETLVEAAIEKASDMIRNRQLKEFHVLDMCTGSGCILISLIVFLKKKFPNVRFYASAADLSDSALQVAKENARRNGVDVSFYQGDMFKALEGCDETFDLILSNPPYIDAAQMKTLPVDVKAFEPAMALMGGEDGLDFYRLLSEECGAFMKEGAAAYFEIGEEQAESVRGLIEKEKDLIYAGCRKDYGGNDRVIAAERR